ncbi:MAG: prenyltransferase/squalene oxidase repeat-containing protein [Candidatus Thorarchaeota archaeon]
MVDIRKTIEFVLNSKSKIDIAKLNVILGNDVEDNLQELFNFYSELQNTDGGFPFQNIASQISTINATTASLHIMLDYGLDDNRTFQNGISFLDNQQNPKGFWNEPHTLYKLNPPIWDDPTNELARIWLTANTCHLLARLKRVNSPNLTKGITFLLENLDENKRLKGYFLTNWIAVAIFGICNGKDDELTKNFVRIIDQNLEKILGTSDLAWCLHCFYDAGFQKNHPIVLRMLDNLISIQTKNGSWMSIDGKEFDITTTVYVLDILEKYDILE